MSVPSSGHYFTVAGHRINKNIVITIVLVLVLVVMSCSGTAHPARALPTSPSAPRQNGRPERQVLEMNYLRAMEETGDRYELDQAVDRMRGRIIISNQPEQLQRGFDRELDGVGQSLNDTF
jgi:hypothetical protein